MTNARKSREKHRMEREELGKLEFEAEQRQTMLDNYQVFKCSGSQDHEPECDKNCGVERLNDLDIEIHKETLRWQELGMIPVGSIPNTPIPGIPIDTFHLETSHIALLNFLMDKGIIPDKEEIDDYYRREKLKRMTIIRERNEDRIKEARARSNIAVPGADILPQIEVPGYLRKKMH